MTTVTDAALDPRRALLEEWLRQQLGCAPLELAPASVDASFRRYFRARDRTRSYIVMDAPPDRENVGPYMAVAAALAAIGLSVPEVLAADRAQGLLLLTDLGSTSYLAALTAGADADRLYHDATAALLTLQLYGGPAAAALPPYDAAALAREVQLFPEWFLGRHLGLLPGAAEQALIGVLCARLSAAALEQPQVFVHRDYHSRNLMLLPERNPGILDFQDALRGALSYDLVSLFKDCYIIWPRERVLGWLGAYRERARAAGLGIPGDAADFVRWFDLVGVQRHLKVLGIFARLWYRDGKRGYLGDLPAVLDYLRAICADYDELAELGRYLREAVAPRFDAAQARALALA